jgi:tetratricopeptide (TPR) repeat protein
MGSIVQRMTEADERLHSWKEIAQFLGRAVRTVQRWEMERGLPVHRAPGGKVGSIYAIKSELMAWMAGAGEEASQTEAADEIPIVEGGASGLSVVEAERGELVPSGAPLEVADRAAKGFDRWGWVGVGGIAAALLGGLLFHPLRLLGDKSEKQAAPVEAKAVEGHVLAGAPHMPAGSPYVPSPAAVELYLRGRYYWEKRTPEDLERAVDLFTQAVVADPGYAQAYSGIADCYNLLREFSTMPPAEAYPRAIAAAKRAVQLDDNAAEAHTSLAFGTLYWNWDWAGAEREFRRAIELKPDLMTTHLWYANALMSRGRFDDAKHEIEIAERLAPASPAVLSSKGLILRQTGKPDEGRAVLEKVKKDHPGYERVNEYLSDFDLADHDAAAYLAERRELVKMTGNPKDRAMLAAAVRGNAAGGFRGMVEAMEGLESHPADGHPDLYKEARFAALLGQREKAMELLQEAYRQHHESICFLAADLELTSLRGEPGFADMASLRFPSHAPQAGDAAVVALVDTAPAHRIR